jgi:hypothetical protein
MHKEQVGKLVESGIDSEDIIGWHGTSFGAIQKMAQIESLLPGTRYGPQLSFVPVQGIGDRAAIEAVGDFAFMHANAHALLGDINGRDEHYAAAVDYFEGKMNPSKLADEQARALYEAGRDHLCEQLDYTEDELNEAYSELVNEDVFGQAQEDISRVVFQSVAVAFSTRVAEDLGVQVRDGSTPQDGSYIVVPEEGLPLEYVTGIEAYDRIVMKFLVSEFQGDLPFP